MLTLIIFGTIVWIIVQASHPKHQRKWAGRFGAPLAIRVRGDVVAIGRQIRAFFTVRRYRKDGWDPNRETF